MFSAYNIDVARAEEEILVQDARESIERKKRKVLREARSRDSGFPNRYASHEDSIEDAMDRAHDFVHYGKFADMCIRKGCEPTEEKMYARDLALIQMVDGRDSSDDWKHIPINRVLIPEEINNIIGMINNGFTFMEVFDHTGILIRQAREGELFRYNESIREKSEMSSRHIQELGDYQPPHQSSAPQGIEEIPPMPMALYERFKKERDSLVVDKEVRTAVRRLSNGAE